ncbi:lipocalin-like domain-containing protein [Cognatishimia maritima]|uniref:Lipocalin-like domain-containing protein n=1 Tax=Cognatishimia maritima TaxID=870908 RepID=A0A1M5IYI4_9RHOB|nr:lipocalin-like domain-containing protein [Cognatishimia maritima]SHG33331.1 Lipocalin-like domain-containing protein [Cognatishimia maritima]
MRDRIPLLGTWSLLSWYNVDETGEKTHPFGQDVSGFIHYSEDGHVFVHMMTNQRPPFESNDPFVASAEEYTNAFLSHISYAGRYTFSGTQVTHNVSQSSTPNWLGTEQVRHVEIDGDHLRLSARNADFQGKRVTAFVDWERVKN